MTTSTTAASRTDLYRAGLSFEHQLKDCRVDNKVLNLKLSARTSTAAFIVMQDTGPPPDVRVVDYVILGVLSAVALRLFLWR